MMPSRRKALAAAFGAAAGSALVPAAAAQAADAQAQLQSRFITTGDGVRLNVLSCVPAAGTGAAATQARPAPTIVLLPGWCMPASIWRAQLTGLGARWRTLALDPRGQGASDVPAGGYTADRRADDLDDLLAGEERVVLVAWSLGVLEALHYVHRHGSGRLHSLILVDNSIGEPPAPKASNFIEQLRRARVATLDAFVHGMFAHPPPPAELDRIRDAALRMPLESSIALLSYPLPREHWRNVAHAFERPLAYVITPRYREQSQNLLRARPASRVEIFERAGHALFVDEAERFNRYVADWIEAFPS
jgi:non-heme chloroperoxidase